MEKLRQEIKKPKLEKLITKLERLDTYQWKLEAGTHGLEFTADINGLIISVKPCLERRPPISGGDLIYHSLVIQNREGNTRIEYSSSKKKSTEEKEIKKFYDSLWASLKENRDKEFAQLLNEFLSSQTDKKQDYTANQKPDLGIVIRALEKIDDSKWNYELGDLGPRFTTKVNGLVFEVRKHFESIGLIKDTFYHALVIKNTEGSIRIKYPNNKTIGKEEIKKVYEHLYKNLIDTKHNEFTRMIDEMLSD